MVAASAGAAHSGRWAHAARVEVLAGVGGFVLALVTWALQLFAPLYQSCGFGLLCRPQGGRISVVDSVRGLGNFVGYYPSRSIGQLILASLVAAGMVAAGASLHGGRGMAAGRRLVWVGCLLEALLLPAVVYTLSNLPFAVTPAMLVEILPGGDLLTLGLGVCAGLAVIAAVAAKETAWDGTVAVRTAHRGQWARAAWVEVLAGLAAFACALLTWASSLFAPLYQDTSGCDQFGCLRVHYVSLVEGAGSLGAIVRRHPGATLLILAFLVAAGMVGVGTYLHGARHVGPGRRLIWGGSILMLVLVSAMSELSVLSFLPLSAAVRPLLSYQTWVGAEVISGPDLLALVLGPSLCVGLAVIATVIAMRAKSAWR